VAPLTVEQLIKYLTERDVLGVLGLDGSIILKCILIGCEGVDFSHLSVVRVQ
jgi:hypothetical protein